jgi:hypothetical protein
MQAYRTAASFRDFEIAVIDPIWVSLAPRAGGIARLSENMLFAV